MTDTFFIFCSLSFVGGYSNFFVGATDDVFGMRFLKALEVVGEFFIRRISSIPITKNYTLGVFKRALLQFNQRVVPFPCLFEKIVINDDIITRWEKLCGIFVHKETGVSYHTYYIITERFILTLALSEKGKSVVLVYTKNQFHIFHLTGLLKNSCTIQMAVILAIYSPRSCDIISQKFDCDILQAKRYDINSFSCPEGTYRITK